MELSIADLKEIYNEDKDSNVYVLEIVSDGSISTCKPVNRFKPFKTHLQENMKVFRTAEDRFNYLTDRNKENKMELKIEDLKVGDVIVNKENSKELTIKCIHIHEKKIYLKETSGHLTFENLIHFKKKEQRKFKVGNKIKFSAYDKDSILTIKELNDKAERYIFEDDTYLLYSGEDGYEIVEQSQYTFDDLIDALKKASKDGVIKIDNIHFTSELGRSFINDIQKEDSEDFEDHIKFIQSLYKETFVIECEEDIKRIKKGAEITLSNSNLLTVKNTYFIVEDHISIDAYTDECTTCQNLNRNIGIVFLKGATVEQSR